MPTTPTDILTRLRAANPAPVAPGRAKEPGAQAALKRILDDPGRGPAPRPPRRANRWLRAAPVLAAMLIALVVVGGALVFLGRGHSRASASRPGGGGVAALIAHTPQRQLYRDLAYAFRAMGSAQSSKACRLHQPSKTTYIQGSPGSDLLSILGVLRRPATPADQLNPRGLSPIPDVYRSYVRRAFSAGGVSYYVVPARYDRAAVVPSDRCYGLLAAALGRYLPRIPAASRQPTRELGAAYIAYIRQIAAEAPRDAIYLVSVPGDGGGSSGQLTPKGIAAGFATENYLGTPAGTFSGVVPDGIAKVTLVLPAFGRQPARALTTSVKGDVYAAHVSGLSRSQVSPTVIWRSPEGRVLKRMSTSNSANRALVCKQSPIACLLAQAVAGSSSSSRSSTSR